METRVTSIRITKAEHDAARHAAIDCGQRLSDWVAQAIRHELERQGRAVDDKRQ